MDALSAIQISKNVGGLDTACKTILRNKEFLAVILKYVVEEYKEYTTEEIMDFIESGSIISPEVTTGRTNTQISGENTEFSQLNEKTSKFDILFKTKNPKLSTEKISVNLIIDIEPQKNYQPGYPIEKRGIYYGARMIASQLSSVIIEDSDYKDIAKVYSIWICRDNIPKKQQYTMSHYTIVNTENIGSYIPKHENYDLFHMAIIRLGNHNYKEKVDLFRFLNALFYPENKDSYHNLTKYIDFKKNSQLEKEVLKMSGLGQSVLEEGMERGMEQGMERGMEQGLKQGRIQMLVSLFQDGCITKSIAAKKLDISEEEFEELLSHYKMP